MGANQVIRIGEALRAMDLPQPSTTRSLGTGGRLTDMDLARARRVVDTPAPPLPECSAKHFNECFRVLTILPRRASDDLTGQLMLAAYQRKLGHLPREQFDWLCDQILERCKWFPSIAECLEIAREWERDDEHTRRRDRAAAAVWREMQARLSDVQRKLARGDATQDEIDGLSDRWRRILHEQGVLKLIDGKYVARQAT